jgi:hypothetical protein
MRRTRRLLDELVALLNLVSLQTIIKPPIPKIRDILPSRTMGKLATDSPIMDNLIVDTVNLPPDRPPMDNHNKEGTHSMEDTNNSKEVYINSNKDTRNNREGISSNKEDMRNNVGDIHLNREDIQLQLQLKVGLIRSKEDTQPNSRNTRAVLHPEDIKTMAESIVLLNWCFALAVTF